MKTLKKVVLSLIKNSDQDNSLNSLNYKNQVNPQLEAFRIAIVYCFIGILWILLSDEILGSLISDISIYKQIQIYKGWSYVIITTIMVYIVIRNRMNLVRKAVNKIFDAYDQLSITHEENISIGQELKEQFEELEKNRDALIESDQRYKLAVEGANDGIWDWDLKNDRYYFSIKYKRSFGYQGSENQNDYDVWKDLLHPEDREQVIKTMENYLLSRTGIYQKTYRLRSSSGGYRWILSRGKAIWNEDGKAMRVAGSHTDITEFVALEETLRREKTFTESIVNDIAIIVLVWDSEGRIKRLNPYGEKVLGYKQEEVLGKRWLDVLVSQEHKDYMGRVFANIKQGHLIKNHENKMLNKEGIYVDILWNSNVLYDDEGKVIDIISVGTDITQRKLMEEKLHSLAYYDTLTGLANRDMLENRFNMLLNEKTDKSSKMAFIYMDIDNFKHVNDTLGHLSGDMLLKHIADILRYHIGQGDLAARLSGDEFALILDNVTDENYIIDRLEKIVKHLRRPWKLEDQEFFISFSMGIAVYPEHGVNLSTLLKNSDTAMFIAKDRGKDNYCFYSNEMQEKTMNYINTTNQLRHAIANDEFILYYQPLVDLSKGKITGVEALIRWIHPTRGFVSPMEFIPLAEEAGYIHEISKWVIETACRQKLSWENIGLGNIEMSINLSSRSLNTENICSIIKEIVEPLKVDFSNIQLEITETAIMSNFDTCISALRQLKELGIKIALDDFGTGYSSLTYLKKLPIDVLKIDRQFIKNITNDNEAKEETITKLVIEMAQVLNLKVVAEGIETVEQLTFLKNHGCDIGQGYFFSKPVPPEEIEKLALEYMWTTGGNRDS